MRYITLTPNPALDVSAQAPAIAPTHKIRCTDAQWHPGGGGINVARVLHRLGAPVLAVYPAGGSSGQRVRELLDAEQLPQRVLDADGPTRESFSVVDAGNGDEYRFVLPGAPMGPALWQRLLAALDDALRDVLRDALHDRPHDGPGRAQPAWVVASGSLPPGLPDDAYAQVGALARRHGARFALDTSGPALRAALGLPAPGTDASAAPPDAPQPARPAAAPVDLIKPSRRELCSLAGLDPAQTSPCLDDAALLRAARQLLADRRATVVALSLGAQGAVLVAPAGAWHAPALDVAVRSTVGAGDSFLAGLLHALDSTEWPPGPAAAQHALAQATAAGAAALLGGGTTLSQPADVQRLVAQVRCRAL